MIDVHELYRQLQLLDEQSAIEAKTGSAIGKSILETVCAYANEPDLGGGHLLLGVAQEEGPTQGGYHAVGVPDVRNAQENLASMCESTTSVYPAPNGSKTQSADSIASRSALRS